MAPTRRILTGITTTGSPHLGNYVGAIRPAIAASRREGVESFYFLADYHALVKCGEPERVRRSTLEIAASWLALGLDPSKVFFYRQSDIPEIPELTWLLTCVTAKGLLNRAHAYKAAVDANREAGEDADAGVTAGLYLYPVLMAADILAFGAHEVPVGRDQVQHIEMARDIAQRFNHLYGEPFFTLPEARVDEQTAVLPGLDGRKMSKSYDNTIPLWLPREQLRRAILSIVTNSQAPGEPKDPDASHLYTIFRAFARPDESEAYAAALRAGLAWGDAKQALFERIDVEIAPARARYDELIAHPERVEALLRQGAEKARGRTRPFLERLRAAVGLRALAVPGEARASTQTPTAAEADAPELVGPYRDGPAFKFRFEDAGERLFESIAYGSGRDAGAVIAALRGVDPGAIEGRETQVETQARQVSLYLPGADAAFGGFAVPPGVDPAAPLARIRAALARWQSAQAG